MATRTMATQEIEILPSLLVITDSQYDISSSNFRIFQAKSIHDFMNQMVVKT